MPEYRLFVEVELLSDSARMVPDLVRAGVLLLGDIAGLLQQRQIDVGLNIALRAGIPVPVPRAAEISAIVDDAYLLKIRFTQTGRSEQAAPAAADNEDVDIVMQRGPRRAGFDFGVVEIVGEVSLNLEILIVAVFPNPPCTFFGVFGAQRIWIEIQLL